MAVRFDGHMDTWGRQRGWYLELELLKNETDSERAKENTMGKPGGPHLNMKIERRCL